MLHVKNNPANLGIFFDELLTNFPANWGKDTQDNSIVPPTNIHETNEGYHVEVSAPGRNKEDFNLNVEKNLLTILFEKKEVSEDKTYKTIRKEFTYGSFKRSFSLDEKIDTTGIQAKYEQGVLKVFLPKKEEVIVTPQKIAIQ